MGKFPEGAKGERVSGPEWRMIACAYLTHEAISLLVNAWSMETEVEWRKCLSSIAWGLLALWFRAILMVVLKLALRKSRQQSSRFLLCCGLSSSCVTFHGKAMEAEWNCGKVRNKALDLNHGKRHKV